MQVLQYLIDKDGLFIWPTFPPEANPSSFNSPGINVVTLTFFNNIKISTNALTGAVTNITPTDPVLGGLSGTIIVQARPTPNSPFLNITNGLLNLAAGEIMLNFEGLATGIALAPGSVAGCNYILCQLTRGA
jgi:hypothetical protein